MEIQISPVESHLYQQIMFPGMLEIRLPEIHPDLLFPGEDGNLLRDWLFALSQALTQREHIIRRYFSTDFALPLFLLPENFLQTGDYPAFLKLLGSMKGEEASCCLLRRLEERSGRKLLRKQEEEILKSIEARRDFFDKAGISAENSWLIHNFLSEPKTALKELQVLYSELRLLSDAMLGPRETEAWQSLRPIEGMLEKDPHVLEIVRKNFVLPEGLEKGKPLCVLCSLNPFEVRVLPEQKALALGFGLPGLIERLRGKRTEELQRLRAFCFALGDERRFRLAMLLASGKRKQMELADELQLTQGTISHHLRVLRESGVMRERGSGLNKEEIRRLIKRLSEELQLY